MVITILPQYVVTAPTMDTFKNRLDKVWLDKVWKNQDIMYDFEAQLHVTLMGQIENSQKEQEEEPEYP